MQVKQSEGHLESLTLSEELDTPDKRTTALAGHLPTYLHMLCLHVLHSLSRRPAAVQRLEVCARTRSGRCIDQACRMLTLRPQRMRVMCRDNAEAQGGWVADWVALRELPSAHGLPLRAPRAGGEGRGGSSGHQSVWGPCQRLCARDVRHRAVGRQAVQQQAHMAREAGPHRRWRPGTMSAAYLTGHSCTLRPLIVVQAHRTIYGRQTCARQRA